MDRIAAIRQIEDALASFEEGEATLEECERRARATVRTFASEFEDGRSAYEADDGTIVVAASAEEAHDRVRELTGAAAPVVEEL